ncbi:uncharacterized protein BO72DRAFT_118042 [Aspergillus fijiensis CBS 313.89]|uniref:Uncharacterized protein n=1 Tax=Aspergillus fijiensis CBS 313.89 TaxID=1448319 RepID=A0A8G1VZ55_9EURO|nr:uncharacterized protein BO72DRAFT_118042 [Aspergillus fijiensis CBS 313.89]RAK76996.1 hypothetical protein BO72DRAFT_118042 [Aspergillus fijiensis CBS 313.89]
MAVAATFAFFDMSSPSFPLIPTFSRIWNPMFCSEVVISNHPPSSPSSHQSNPSNSAITTPISVSEKVPAAP